MVPFFCLNVQNTQVFQQNFQTNENEDGAACKFRFGFPPAAEQVADFYADHGQCEGDDSDKGHRRNNVHLQKRQGNAYR